ncbi:MAG: nucleotidyltransferase domain-containing protein [Cyanobacteria bacterium P01_C01_bin.118]
MVTSPTPAEMERYIATARKRKQAEQQQKEQRQQQGWQIASQAAALLKEHFHVQRVWLFGSMVTLHRIHPNSDIDLAVQGLNPAQYLAAVTELLDVSEFSIDVVQIEYAQPSLRETIAQQGLEL